MPSFTEKVRQILHIDVDVSELITSLERETSGLRNSRTIASRSSNDTSSVLRSAVATA
jgi:hypothetical protein